MDERTPTRLSVGLARWRCKEVLSTFRGSGAAECASAHVSSAPAPPPPLHISSSEFFCSCSVASCQFSRWGTPDAPCDGVGLGVSCRG